MKLHLQCAEQQVSRSNLTKYCACHAERLTYLIIITYETSFTMRGATGVTIQPHQILHLSGRKTRILSLHHIWNLIYNARSNQCHPPNSPNTAPATQNDHLTSGRTLRKTGETSFPMRGRSEHDPTMIRPWKRKPQPASPPRLLFELPRSIFYCKIQRFAPNLTFKPSPNAAPATKSNTTTSRSTAPATKSDTWTSPSTASATKSDTSTSRSTAPATKNDTLPLLYCTQLYWTLLLYSTLLNSTLLYCNWTTVLYSTLLFWTLLYCTVTELYSTLLYCSVTELCSTLLYSTLLYSTELYWTLPNSTVLNCNFTELWLYWTVTLLNCDFTELWLYWTVTLLNCDFTLLWLYWTVTLLYCDFTELQLYFTDFTALLLYFTEL